MITTLSRELQNLAASTFLRRENSNELVAEVTDGFSAFGLRIRLRS